jgi:formylglycine-generating enzyme
VPRQNKRRSGIDPHGTPDSPCCGPSRDSGPGADEVPRLREGDGSTTGMVRVDGGTFLMGSDEVDGFPADGEGPVREIDLRPFWMDPVAAPTSASPSL